MAEIEIKSSLINEILYKSLAKSLNRAHKIPGKHKKIEGIDKLDKIIALEGNDSHPAHKLKSRVI